MTVRLHRCTATFVRGPHPCWQVQKALDEAGIEFEVVKHPSFPRGKRTEVIALTGQKLLPVIEIEDGTAVRKQSSELVAEIRDGRLFASQSA